MQAGLNLAQPAARQTDNREHCAQTALTEEDKKTGLTKIYIYFSLTQKKSNSFPNTSEIYPFSLNHTII